MTESRNAPRSEQEPLRDPESGFLLPHRCELYEAGHMVHYIQANRSYGEAHRTGTLVDVQESAFSVEFADEIKTYRNHEVERLVDIAGLDGRVRVCEAFSILRAVGDRFGSYCFSILKGDRSWVPCDYEPLSSFTPESLASRLLTHGGFLVPGHLLLKSDDGEDGRQALGR